MVAQWEAVTYTISYNANGGTGEPEAQTKTHGVTLTLSDKTPTKEGYNFLGWATSSTATSAVYSPGDDYINNTDAILYAVWTQASTTQTIMARYQQPDGSFTNYSTVKIAVLEEGETCEWAQPETEEYHATSIEFLVGTAPRIEYVTVYRKQYGIIYHANEGLFPPQQQKFYYGDDNLKLVNKRPTRSGYDFLGWATMANAVEAKYLQNDAFNGRDTSNPTLYAVWKKREGNVYFYRNGSLETIELIESDE